MSAQPLFDFVERWRRATNSITDLMLDSLVVGSGAQIALHSSAEKSMFLDLAKAT